MQPESAPVDRPVFNNRRYRIIAPLGVGGMGAVYHAYDRLTGEAVALKQVRLDPSQKHASESARVRFGLAREFQALAALRHPHIIGVRDYGFDARGQPFFTMDLLAGSPTILEAGHKRSLEFKVTLLAQLLYALAYIHRRGIVHRDLKPGNVLVAGDQVKLLDFGLAGLAGQEEGPVGTLAYMAPEVLEGQPATPAADFYSFGVLAYELLVGRHPFHTARHDIIDAILSEEPDWILVRPELRKVLAGLLSKRPAERPAESRAVLAALSEAIGQPLPLENQATRESFLKAAPFVGRQSEVDQLLQALNETAQGHGSAWLIGGESGVGKSRLLDEVRTRALVQGLVVLQGQAVSEGGGPLHMWAAAARWLGVLAEPDDLQAAVLEAIVPDMASLLERPIPPAPTLPPLAAQTRLLGVFVDLIRRVAQHAPLAIFLSDLHWADENSLALLARLNEALAEMPLLILADYRNDEAPHLPQRLPTMQTLTVERLPANDIAELSASMLGRPGRATHIVNYLQRESEGNTFFIVEVVRALAETAGQLDRVAQMTLPTRVFGGGIQRVVERRLRNVPASDQRALEWAALMGRQLDLDLLGALGVQAMDAWLTRCVDAAVLERQNEAWRFQHDKLREGLLLELDPGEVAARHRQIGETIERVYGPDLSQFYVRLVYHFQQAGETAREARYAWLAGEQAAKQFANEQAIDFLSRALTLTPVEQLSERYRILCQREEVYSLIEDRAAQKQDLEALMVIAEALAEPVLRAEALQYEAAYADDLAEYEQALQLIEPAVALAQTAGAKRVEADLQLLAARVYLGLGRYSEVRQAAGAALVLAQTAGLPAAEALAERRLGLAADYLNERTLAETHYLRALALYQQIGDLRGQASAYSNLSTNAPYRGEIAASLEYSEKSAALARATGDRYTERIQLSHQGMLATGFGDYVYARQCIQQMLDSSLGGKDRASEAWGLAALGSVDVAEGDYAAAETHSQASLTLTQASGERNVEMIALHNLGAVWLAQNRLDEAAEVYRTCARINEEIDPGTPPVAELVALAQIDLLRGERAQARERLEPVLPYLTPDYLFGMDESFNLEWQCYRVLKANADPRAEGILAAAQTRLRAYAAKLPEKAQDMFLGLKLSREILGEG